MEFVFVDFGIVLQSAMARIVAGNQCVGIGALLVRAGKIFFGALNGIPRAFAGLVGIAQSDIDEFVFAAGNLVICKRLDQREAVGIAADRAGGVADAVAVRVFRLALRLVIARFAAINFVLIFIAKLFLRVPVIDIVLVGIQRTVEIIQIDNIAGTLSTHSGRRVIFRRQIDVISGIVAEDIAGDFGIAGTIVHDIYSIQIGFDDVVANLGFPSAVIQADAGAVGCAADGKAVDFSRTRRRDRRHGGINGFDNRGARRGIFSF